MHSARPVLALTLLYLAAACSEAPTRTATPEPTEPQLITNGVPTGSNFGNVGALLYDFDENRVIDGRNDFLCSGSLIAPTVFLTAGHCLDFLPAGAQVYVSFDPTLLPEPSGLIAAEAFHVHPALLVTAGIAKNDLGVVLLPAGATSGITPLELPPVGYLDALAAQGGLRGQLFLNVGYGYDATSRGQPRFAYDGVRKVSRSPFKGLTSDWLSLLMNTKATGQGGVCLGDSGSPKFLAGNTNLVVAVTSWVDYFCRATSFSQRVDTPSARAFLRRFVALP